MNLDLDKSTWKRVRFGDVVRNVNKSTKDPESLGIGRVIAMEHMDPGELKIDRWGDLADGTTFTRVVTPGQTLFGKRRAYQRKVAYAEFDAICSGDIYTFEAIEGELLPRLLPFLVQSEGFFNHALGTSAGSLSPRTNWRDLAGFEFGLPPIEEQERFADLLWAVEEHMRALHNQRSSTATTASVLRHELFSSAGPVMRADAAFEITIGRQRSPKHQTGDHLVKYLRSANITSDGVDISDVLSMNFEPFEQTKFRLEPGDVLVTEASASTKAVGMPAVWQAEIDETVCFQNTLLRFRSVEGISLPGFVDQWCRWAFESGAFLSAASGTNIRHIGMRGASAMSVLLPELKTQEQWVSRLQSIDDALQKMDSELAVLTSMRKAILNKIFGDI